MTEWNKILLLMLSFIICMVMIPVFFEFFGPDRKNDVMKKINWTPKRSRTNSEATVGNIIMRCERHYLPDDIKSRRWFAYVSWLDKDTTFRYGPVRKSSLEAQKDAVRIACEMLLDYYTCLKVEMDNFGLIDSVLSDNTAIE